MRNEINYTSLQPEKIILGIDPGTNIMGFGLVAQESKKIRIIDAGVIKLSKLENQALKLKNIFQSSLNLIEKYHPDELAIESQFFGKNIQSMLKLGRAQGVAIAAALYRDIPVFEYSPRKVKQSITGRGSASKEQVAAFICTLLNINHLDLPLDASDALAIAICHLFQNKPDTSSSSYSGWAAFAASNPDRIKK